jgi:hypothetical protein
MGEKNAAESLTWPWLGSPQSSPRVGFGFDWHSQAFSGDTSSGVAPSFLSELNFSEGTRVSSSLFD